jgi:hypothetical protein
MKIERFVGYNEAREALVLSVAGVTAIMLIANLILMAGIDQRIATGKKKATRHLVAEVVQWRPRPLPKGAAPNSSQSSR